MRSLRRARTASENRTDDIETTEEREGGADGPPSGLDRPQIADGGSEANKTRSWKAPRVVKS
jgi:hypothetical protein